MNEFDEIMTEENEVVETYDGGKDHSDLIGAGVLVAGGALAYKGGEILVKKVIVPGARKLWDKRPWRKDVVDPDEIEVIEEVSEVEEK